MSDPRKSRAYQKKRAAFLAYADPVCHWCQAEVFATAPRSHPRKATVDHLVEVDTAPLLALDTSLWVVACLSCNSSRGSRYAARLRRPTRPRSSRDW